MSPRGGGSGGKTRSGHAHGNGKKTVRSYTHSVRTLKADPFSLQRLLGRREGGAGKEARENPDALGQLVDPRACFPRQSSSPCACGPWFRCKPPGLRDGSDPGVDGPE